MFSAPGSNWSFVEVIPGTDQVIRTAEKNRISDKCSNGLYYFRSGEVFIEALENYYREEIKGETFIAPIYNYLVSQSSVRIVQVNNDDIVAFGTPEEYMLYLKKVIIG